MSSSKRDYYEILGVSRSADDAAIKKAFRKLALEHHPDRNADPESADRFREAQEAYAVLSDTEKRSLYDQYGHSAFAGAAGGSPFTNMDDVFSGFQSIFEDFFGGGARSRAQSRGADLLYRLELSFREAALGTTKNIEVNRLNRCEVCDGSGARPGTGPEACSICGGRGKISRSQGFFVVSQTCYNCGGRGKVIRDPCQKCRGLGRYEKRQEIEVNIPAGVDTGVRLRIANEGELPEIGFQRGDLFVEINVKADDVFERDGADLYTKVFASFPIAVLGGEVEVPLLEGTSTVKVPAGMSSPHRAVLKNQGIKDLRSHRRGDLIIEVHVEVPKKLSPEAKNLVEQLKTELEKDSSRDSSPPHPPQGKKKKKSFFNHLCWLTGLIGSAFLNS